MFTLVDSIILGTVQGLTEFLPVSSSGHLIFARELLGINTGDGLAFDAVLQLGTILAVYIYFWPDIIKLGASAWRFLLRKTTASDAPQLTLLRAIILGTIPAMIIGLVLQKWMDSYFRSAWLVAIDLLLGSLLIYAAEKYARFKKSQPTDADSIAIGFFQSLALVPGISRSGASISGGLFRGLTRESATRFSFLLSIPIITGTGLLKLIKIIKLGPAGFTTSQLAVAFVVSAVVGYFAIRWFLQFLKTNTLIPFVWYRVTLACIVLVTLFIR